jgi:dipeptidyl aminopeptidase/acylaminoacyl peptidase
MKVLTVFAVLVLSLAALTAAGQSYTIEQYLSVKAASAPTFSPDGTRIAFLSNHTGTSQVWTVLMPTGNPRQLTNYDDNVSFVRWLADGSGLVFGKAKGGDENTQFFWMRPDGTGVRTLTTDPTVRHNFGAVSWDGKTLWYASNKRNRTFFDIYSMDIASGREELRYQQDGNNSLAAVNDSGTKFIVSRDGIDLSLDDSLYLVDTRTKAEMLLTPHEGPVQYGNVNFVADGIVFTHNQGREFQNLAQMRRKNAASDDWSLSNLVTDILDKTPWDVSGVEMSTYGNTMVYTVNREGFSEMFVRKYETGGKPLITTFARGADPIKLPGRGIVGAMALNKDQSKLAFTFAAARNNSDIWLYDLRTKHLNQVTVSDTSGIHSGSFVEPKLIKYKTFDGREVPAWYYLPNLPRSYSLTMGDSSGLKPIISRVPVIVSVHGGPEGQERPGFNGLYQYYLSRGYAILAPNVRGSTGYGKTYTHLDDVKKREDSVKDLAYAVEWLKTSGNADPNRIAVMGGSYGGYMTLAAITLYPEIWSAAVSTVGIANWESFLKNTSGYRRRQREVEYGRLDRDLDFLRSISPLARVDRIKCPLFVIQGRNDPRVPYTESEQIVAAVKRRGGIVEYKLYADEGHGISKLKNRLELYPLVADFLDKYMGKKESARTN